MIAWICGAYFLWLWAFVLYLTCAAPWMTACLFLLRLKEAELILMGSEHLLHKVTPTGLAYADPCNTQSQAANRKHGAISNLLSSPLSSNVRNNPHYHLRNRATRSQLCLPPAAPGGKLQVFLLWDWWLQFVFLGLPPRPGQAAARLRSPPDAKKSADCFWAGHASVPSVKYHIDFRAFLLPSSPGP